MTASVNRRGQLVLEPDARESMKLREGDLLVVRRDKRGRLVLQKRKPQVVRRDFLNPLPLKRSVLAMIYSSTDREWEAVEREAVDLSRKALAGQSVESL